MHKSLKADLNLLKTPEVMLENLPGQLDSFTIYLKVFRSNEQLTDNKINKIIIYYLSLSLLPYCL